MYNIRYKRDDCVVQAYNCNKNTLKDILLNCTIINITKASNKGETDEMPSLHKQ